jgi:protein-L-isoaspartate(D-aspartate) O-methyltransferase
MKNNEELVEEIKHRAPFYIDSIPRDNRVLEAMLKIDRIDFLPLQDKKYAYEDHPVPIGNNQTCSQPSMVAFMLDKLEIKQGNIILEIGAGCGYASAIASKLCGSSGFIYACEIVPELAEKMRYNLAPFIENIKIISGDGSAGFPQYAPFNRILISAGITSQNFKEEILLEQLSDGGILLYPESYGNIYKIKKSIKGLIKDVYHGVSFVPLKGKNS